MRKGEGLDLRYILELRGTPRPPASYSCLFPERRNVALLSEVVAGGKALCGCPSPASSELPEH